MTSTDGLTINEQSNDEVDELGDCSRSKLGEQEGLTMEGGRGECMRWEVAGEGRE